ncbi:helix-turn-helix transcriptional regulator [Roseateles sp.]|uniref:helix-turn-helix domain-containing protein n=1 Tax=Roseateles sp. TaxID=1971397 RepID=UPI0031DEEBEE
MTHFTVRTSGQFSILLKAFRRQAGLTQREVASRLGVTQQTYSALERNAAAACSGKLLKVLNVLGADLVLAERVKTAAHPQESPEESRHVAHPRW